MNTNNYKPNNISYAHHDLWEDPEPKTEPEQRVMTKDDHSTAPKSSRFKEEIRRFGFRYYSRSEAVINGFDWDGH